MEPIELDYQLTAKEWRDLTIRRRFGGKSGLGILAIAALVGVAMWFTQSGSTASKAIAAACGFFGSSAPMVILSTISAIRAWRSNPDLHRVRHYVFTPDEVLVTTDLSTSAISWEFFSGITETRRSFMLQSTIGTEHSIPKRLFRDSEQCAAFVGMVHQNLRNLDSYTSETSPNH